MWQGSVVSIHITKAAGQPMDTVPEARAVAGRGLEGDRYFLGTGYYSGKPGEGGREFQVGAVRRRGTRLCEPCKYLDGLTQAGAMSTLLHRGGLRALILSDGVIRAGDTITPG